MIQNNEQSILDFEDNPEALEAYRSILETGNSLFLTGKAGTGKTTLLKAILKDCKKQAVLIAPTGVAAKHMGGMTIHSFFQLPLDDRTYLGIGFPKIRYSEGKKSLLRKLELLVIDEISMVTPWVLNQIDLILKNVRKSDRNFGGVQILLVGDPFQLPPVVDNASWKLFERNYATPFFFDSPAYKASNFLQIDLQKNYRQLDDTFMWVLNQLRQAKTDQELLGLLNEICLGNEISSTTEFKSIVLAPHKARVKQLNDEALEKIDAKKWFYPSHKKGSLNASNFPAENDLVLKVGAQVMFVKNNFKAGYANGTMGIVQFLSQDVITVRLEDGRIISVEKEDWYEIDYWVNTTSGKIQKKKIGTFTQYPLCLAWAITIHKSQGLTFDSVLYDNTRRAFGDGQVYVALSRCRTLEGLRFAHPLSASEIKLNKAVLSFSESLKKYPHAA